MLLGLVDADYKLIWADVGSNSAASDAQFFTDSELKEAIENYVVGFPPADLLPNDDRDTPYFIVGDDAFNLRTWMMKPYGRRGFPVVDRIFNYRLSRARQIVENAFGILANRFGCLLTTSKQQPPVVIDIILSCTCLHNLMLILYLALKNASMDAEDDQLNLIPGDWRNGAQMQDILNIVGGNINMSHQAAETISEAVLQLTYRNCPMATGPYIKQDTYTCALLRVHKSPRNELYIMNSSDIKSV